MVGARGFIGKRLESRIKSQEWDVTGLDKGDDLDRLVDFDVVISATGVAGLIKKEMVKQGWWRLIWGFRRVILHLMWRVKRVFLHRCRGEWVR